MGNLLYEFWTPFHSIRNAHFFNTSYFVVYFMLPNIACTRSRQGAFLSPPATGKLSVLAALRSANILTGTLIYLRPTRLIFTVTSLPARHPIGRPSRSFSTLTYFPNFAALWTDSLLPDSHGFSVRQSIGSLPLLFAAWPPRATSTCASNSLQQPPVDKIIF